MNKKKSLSIRIKKKIENLKIQIACKYDAICINAELKKNRNSDKIFLFGSPNQVNLGDQAQTYCIENWLKKNYPQHKIFTFTYYTITDTILRTIRQSIGKNDLIFIHSGYHITDLYNLIDKYCKIIQLFPDYHIVIMPQTINFEKDKNKEKLVSTIFNSHGNITLMCRDDISYKKAQNIFSNCKLLLYPDIVTSLIGLKRFENKREGILFCMRNDKEAFYNNESISLLRDRLSPIKTEITDTDSKYFYRTIQHHREKILEDKWNEFSRYKVIVTDRYHGTIFSLIANTPVIVLSSTDHKLSSGVKWFPNEFGEFVSFAKDLDEAYELALARYNGNIYKNLLTPYFEENFYSKLKKMI